MRFPHRSITSIRPLPSIYTTFPANHESSQSLSSDIINSGTCLLRPIEDGIEVVPFERSRTPSAPILSPEQDEKEVFISQIDLDVSEKPLPNVPQNRWERISIKRRILIILCAQFVILLTVGLALMSAKRKSASDQVFGARVAGDGIPNSPLEPGPIKRGSFAIPIRLPQLQSSACLAKTNESVAWQCTSDTFFQLNVLPSAGNDSMTMITLGPPLVSRTMIHGHQVPLVQLVELKATQTKDNGLSYHFRTTYDRVVLLREDDLTQADDKPRAQPLMRHPAFQTGDALWRCLFNETMIEGYLYVNQATTPEILDTSANATASSNAVAALKLPKVPYVVKLIEERMPNGRTPYCEKMTVQQDGTLLSNRSQNVSLSLVDPAAEVDASPHKRFRRMQASMSRQIQQSPSMSHCRCQWLIQ